MASKEQNSSYEIRPSLYEKLIATNLEITRKGKAYAYTSHNGHMFSLLSPSGELGRYEGIKRRRWRTGYSTITSTTHAAFNALGGQERLELLAGVLPGFNPWHTQNVSLMRRDLETSKLQRQLRILHRLPRQLA